MSGVKNTNNPKNFLSFKYFEQLVVASILLFVGAMLFVVFAFMSKSAQQEGLQKHFNLVYLSQELRLSSDQLTMMARAYAATGNEKFKQFFEQIIAIRSGVSPRPQHLNRVYWDMMMVEDGQAPSASGKPQSLLSLLEENGASTAELNALTHAYNQSESLVQLEKQAFALVEQGDRSGALAILYSEDYLQSKVAIMTPINSFLANREEKLQTFIQESSRQLTILYSGALLCFLLLLATLLVIYNARSSIRNNIIAYLNNEVKNQTKQLTVKNSALNEAIADLKHAQARLVSAEKSATLMRLIPGLAHEINTPVGIAVTASSSQLMALEAVKSQVSENKIAKATLLETIDTIEDCANLVGNSANRISTIINKLKIITQDGFTDKAQTLVLADEVKACLSAIDKPELDVKVSLDVDEQIRIHAPKFLLQQCLCALIENSFNHAFEPDSLGQELRIQANLINDKLTIRIFDNGHGVPDSIKDKLFDAFVVGNRNAKGMGLGLSLAMAIINQYFCGTLEYQPHTDGGTCFVISMPIDGFLQSTAREQIALKTHA